MWVNVRDIIYKNISIVMCLASEGVVQNCYWGLELHISREKLAVVKLH